MPAPRYILVVDDDDETRSSMRNALEAAGYRVKTAANGKEALAILTSGAGSPSLVLLDLAMPVMDGYQVLENLRTRPELGSVPVMVVTALSYDSRLSHTVGYMRKPARLDQIVAAARTWCPAAAEA